MVLSYAQTLDRRSSPTAWPGRCRQKQTKPETGEINSSVRLHQPGDEEIQVDATLHSRWPHFPDLRSRPSPVSFLQACDASLSSSFVL